MANISLIYAYWPNQPYGITWSDLPWAMRTADLPKTLHEAGHNLVESMLAPDTEFPEELVEGFKLAGDIAEAVADAKKRNELAVVLCGSCILAAVGSISGLGPGTSVIWMDAHPDLNTPETTVSGLPEGMALAAASGLAYKNLIKHYSKLKVPLSLSNVTLVGTRDIDECEKLIIDANKISILSLTNDLKKTFQHTDNTYVHLDMDVHDSLAVRTNTYPIPNGLQPNQIKEILQSIPKIDCIAITGLDPQSEDADKACELAISYIQTAAKDFK